MACAGARRAGARSASDEGVAVARIDRAIRRHVRGRTIRGASDEGSRSIGSKGNRNEARVPRLSGPRPRTSSTDPCVPAT